MRKIVVFLGVLAILGLMMGGAQANELINGNFQTGDLTGWTPATGHNSLSVWDKGSGDYVAGKQTLSDEGAIYQVADDKTGNPNWNDNYTNKFWVFSAKVFATSGNVAELYLFYYDSNPATAPTFTNPDDPGSHWLTLVSGESGGNGYFYGPTDLTAAYSGTIHGFQPRWFAVSLEAQINNPGTGQEVYFNNVTLDGACLDIPLPPAVWLFGSGLLGLVGWRRFKA